MKTITIIEYLKYSNAVEKSKLPLECRENAYRSGYWNVKKYSAELEQFLIANNIEFKIEEK